MEAKSLEEVCEYLEDQEFPESVLESFRGLHIQLIGSAQKLIICLEHQLDGSAIAVGIASSPGPNWLTEVVPTLGTRLKVHQALRTWQASLDL